MSVHVFDLKTGKQKKLLDNAVQAWYLPSGYLFYIRGTAWCFVAPFDSAVSEITGPAVPVLERVQVDPGDGFALLTWSPSVRWSMRSGNRQVLRQASIVYGWGRDGSASADDRRLVRAVSIRWSILTGWTAVWQSASGMSGGEG